MDTEEKLNPSTQKTDMATISNFVKNYLTNEKRRSEKILNLTQKLSFNNIIEANKN